MNPSMRVLCVLILGAVLLAGLTGCDSALDEQPARIRVVHAAPGTAALDFFIDFDLFTRGLSFRNATPYTRWKPGLRRLEVRLTQAGREVSLSKDVLIDQDETYTVLVTGAADAASLVLLQEDRLTPSAGQSRLRIANGARNIGALDARATDEAGHFAVEVFGLGYGAATPPTPLDAGRYDFVFGAAAGSAAAALTGQPLDAGRRYLVVVANTATSTALTAFTVVDG